MNSKPSELMFSLKFKPRDWQIKAAKLTKAFKRLCISTKRGEGKTTFGAIHLLHQAFAMKKDKPCSFAFVSHTRQHAHKRAAVYLKDLLGEHVPDIAVFSETEGAFKFFNMNSIRLFGMDDIEAMRGSHFDGVFVDESQLLDVDDYTKIVLPSVSVNNGFLIFAGIEDTRGWFSSLCDKGRNANESTLITLTV